MFDISTYTGGVAETNGWLLQTDAGTIAFDAPEGMAAWLDRRGIKLDALVLTHQHFDHVWDVAKIKASQGCPVIAFAPYSKTLTLELLYATAAAAGFSIEPYAIDQVIEGRESIALAGLDFKVLHVPGHSPDSICFHASEQGVLFAGDVLFAGSIGRTDLPGGSTRQLLTGIASKIMVLDDSTRVFPGHGPDTTIGDERGGNPYLE
jgi:glyoxylase-like metal-dependent hydrolase (beta-lactamase superfamily II)